MCELCQGVGLERSCSVCGGFDVDDFNRPSGAFDRLCESCLAAFRKMALSWR